MVVPALQPIMSSAEAFGPSVLLSRSLSVMAELPSIGLPSRPMKLLVLAILAS
jgi:hypothetical protein